ncbi:MAG TPA: hypothetical protein VKV57_06680 [bacterium]|nr:hypothetical protein [bacterium]
MGAPVLIADVEAEDLPHDLGLGLVDHAPVAQDPNDLSSVVEDGFAAVAVGEATRAVPCPNPTLQAPPGLLGEVPPELLVHHAFDPVDEPRGLGVRQRIDTVRSTHEPNAEEL